jgi:cytochrome c
MEIISTFVRSIAAAAVVTTLWTALTGHGMAASTIGPPPQPPLAGDPVTGARIYQICMGCHSLDENDVGPRHRGVVGRKAGSVPGYAYSAALRRSGIVWTPDLLDRWLSGPQALVPGAKMYFSVANPRNRADIIAFLAQQK